MTRNLKIHTNHQNYSSFTGLNLKIKPSQHIFAGIGENFYNLASFEVSNQSLKFIERDDFVGLPKLEALKLNENQIEFLPVDVFLDLPKLYYLNLEGNQIKELPENLLKNLRSLKKLKIHSNKINHLPKNLFAYNLILEAVNFRNNPIKTIDVDFKLLPNLKIFNETDESCFMNTARNKKCCMFCFY